MIFSPQSDLSSFRDYYQNSTEREYLHLEKTEKITLGYRNFQMSKVLHRLEWKISRNNSQSLMSAFKRISFQMQFQDLKVIQRGKLGTILQRLRREDGRSNKKKRAMNQWLTSTRERRNFELQIMRIEKQLKYFFMRKCYNFLYIAFETMSDNKNQKQQQLDKNRAKYIKKLCKALLSIVFRNRIHFKMKTAFEGMKSSDLASRNTSNITFFKPKKGKKVYECKEDSKISQLVHCSSIYSWILKKVQTQVNFFFINFIRSTRKGKVHKKKQKLSDSPQIMVDVVKHMIFLTNKITIETSEKNISEKIGLKGLKLKSLLINISRRSRHMLSRCLFHWRKTVKQENSEIEREIAKLQEIKRYYIQQA